MNINDLVYTYKTNSNQNQISYIDFLEGEVDQSKVDALERKKKIEIFRGEDVSETQSKIDEEIKNPTVKSYDFTTQIQAKAYVKSVTLSPFTNRKNVDQEIISKIKSLANTSYNFLSQKGMSGGFELLRDDISKFNITIPFNRRVINKIQTASNYIATNGRIGPADFVILNLEIRSELYEYIENNMLFNRMNVIVDPSLRDEIIVGRKSDSGSIGLKVIINDATNHYAIIEVGYFPEKFYMSIKLL